MRIGWDAPFPALPPPEVLTGRKSRATGRFLVYTQLFHEYPHPVFSEMTLYMGVCLLGTFKQRSYVHSFSCLADLFYIYPSVHLYVIPIYLYIYRSSILLLLSVHLLIIYQLSIYPNINNLSISIMYYLSSLYRLSSMYHLSSMYLSIYHLATIYSSNPYG